MSRLTEKGTRKATQCGYEIKTGDTTIRKFVPNPETVKECAMYNKLADLEDIEEEIGIDALLYLKVMSHQVVYIKGKEPEWGGVGDESEIESYHVMRFTKDRLEVRFAYSDTYATHVIENPLNSYGKSMGCD